MSLQQSWRGPVGALAAALLVLGARPAAAQLAGTWLIEPESFDAAVENGVDVARWPVLVVGEDRGFRLYRLGAACLPVDGDGVEIEPPASAAACARAAAANARDGLGAAAALIAAGTLERRTDGGLRFAVGSTAPVPRWWQRQVAEAAALPRPPGELPEAQWRQMLPTLATFYTTAHLADGAWLRGGVTGDRLVLTPAGGAPFAWRRVSAGALVATTDLLDVYALSGLRYFRCLLGLVEGTRGGGPDRDGLLAAARRAGELLALSARLQQAAALSDEGKDDAAQAMFGDDARAALAALNAQVRAYGLNDRGETAGAFLGCPERDGLF